MDKEAIISSCPRSGTNWLVHSLCYMSGLQVGVIRGHAGFSDVEDQISKHAHGQRIYYGHIPLWELPEKYRVVCLLRDRRDSVVSMAWRKAKGDFSERVRRLWKTGGDKWQVLWWDAYHKLCAETPHLLVRYEDLLVNPQQKMLEVWDYLALCQVSGRERPSQALLNATLTKYAEGTSPTHPKRRGVAGEWGQRKH